MQQLESQQADWPILCAISDGRAGNARQASALAAALDSHARQLVLAPRAPWRWLAPRALPGAPGALGGDFARLLAQPPTLAIGCGRQAALATRLLGARGARTVQILDPRIAARHWNLLVLPEHDRRHGDNIIPMIGSLNPVDDTWLAQARRDFPAFSDLPGPRTALLLGGPTAHARYDASTLRAACTEVAQRAIAESGSVLATVSRRTPAPMAAMLHQALSGLSGLVWRGANDGPNPYPGLLAWADRIVCSPDSVNMVSEACATRAPVEVFGIGQCDGRPRRFLDTLLELRRIHAPGQGPAGLAAEPLRETARVARLVRERLGVPQGH